MRPVRRPVKGSSESALRLPTGREAPRALAGVGVGDRAIRYTKESLHGARGDPGVKSMGDH